jgi:pyrophosphate--fructose-6-phosphate 1-phosphotransferase
VFAGEDRKIMPATFKPSDIRLTGEHHERVMASFPRSIAQNQNIVLEGVRSASPRRVNGKRVAVLFSGGPAAGGHNVLAGIKAILGPGNTLLGVGEVGDCSMTICSNTAQDANPY